MPERPPPKPSDFDYMPGLPPPPKGDLWELMAEIKERNERRKAWASKSMVHKILERIASVFYLID